MLTRMTERDWSIVLEVFAAAQSRRGEAMERQMSLPNDLSRSLTEFDPCTTLIAVVELSLSSWLIAGLVPDIECNPLKKMEPNEAELLRLLEKWRDEAVKAGSTISHIAVAFEAGRDGFWLARWLRARGIDVHVIHSSSVAISREHRRAKGSVANPAIVCRGYASAR